MASLRDQYPDIHTPTTDIELSHEEVTIRWYEGFVANLEAAYGYAEKRKDAITMALLTEAHTDAERVMNAALTNAVGMDILQEQKRQIMEQAEEIFEAVRTADENHPDIAALVEDIREETEQEVYDYAEIDAGERMFNELYDTLNTIRRRDLDLDDPLHDRPLGIMTTRLIDLLHGDTPPDDEQIDILIALMRTL